MKPYKQTQFDTLMALILESNPGMTVALTPDDLQALTPTAYTPGTGEIQNTTLRLTVKANNAKYFGAQTVKYRRISLSSLCRSIGTLSVSMYVPGSTMTTQQVADALNATYGLVLQASDFTNPTVGFGTVVQPLNGSSLLYADSSFLLSATKIQGVPLDTAIPTGVLTGKTWPNGNTFPRTKPEGQFLAYGLNCASIAANLKALSATITMTPSVWTTDANAIAVMAFLKASLPGLNLSEVDSATAGGLGNLVMQRYSIANVNVPNANSAKYTFVTTLTAVAGSWFQGQILLHYT